MSLDLEKYLEYLDTRINKLRQSMFTHLERGHSDPRPAEADDFNMKMLKEIAEFEREREYIKAKVAESGDSK